MCATYKTLKRAKTQGDLGSPKEDEQKKPSLSRSLTDSGLKLKDLAIEPNTKELEKNDSKEKNEVLDKDNKTDVSKEGEESEDKEEKKPLDPVAVFENNWATFADQIIQSMTNEMRNNTSKFFEKNFADKKPGPFLTLIETLDIQYPVNEEGNLIIKKEELGAFIADAIEDSANGEAEVEGKTVETLVKDCFLSVIQDFVHQNSKLKEGAVPQWGLTLLKFGIKSIGDLAKTLKKSIIATDMALEKDIDSGPALTFRTHEGNKKE